MNALDEFAGKYQPQAEAAPQALAVTAQELQAAEKRLFSLCGGLGLPGLDEEERQQMVVRHRDILPELLVRSGVALARHPELCAATGATADTFSRAAAQSFAVRGLLAQAERTARTARQARFLVNEELLSACARVKEAARKIMDEGDEAARSRAQAAFAGVALLAAERERTAKQKLARSERRLRPLREQREATENEIAALKIITSFLDSVAGLKEE